MIGWCICLFPSLGGKKSEGILYETMQDDDEGSRFPFDSERSGRWRVFSSKHPCFRCMLILEKRRRSNGEFGGRSAWEKIFLERPLISIWEDGSSSLDSFHDSILYSLPSLWFQGEFQSASHAIFSFHWDSHWIPFEIVSIISMILLQVVIIIGSWLDF